MQIKFSHVSPDDSMIKILTATPIFNGIKAFDIATMLDCLNPRVFQYDKNELIASAGEAFYGIGIVIEGSVMVTKESLDGNRSIMTILHEGDMFGEMVCFTPEPVWPATILAQIESKVLFISPEKVISQCEQVCVGHRKLIENFLVNMSKKALMLNRKVEYLSLKTLRGKLSAFLLEQSKQSNEMTFICRMNRDEIADFLNVTRPSVSRELSRMKDDGLIDYYKSSFKIVDLEKMQSCIY